MSRKKTPAACLLDEGAALVKHTHDIDLATTLVKQAVAEDGDWTADEIVPTNPRVIWCRIINTLPGSWAEAEGYAWTYAAAPGPGRGVFPAVEFLHIGVKPQSFGGAA